MKYAVLLLLMGSAHAETQRFIKTVPASGGVITFTADGQSQSMPIQPGTYEIVITVMGGGSRPRIGHRKH